MHPGATQLVSDGRLDLFLHASSSLARRYQAAHVSRSLSYYGEFARSRTRSAIYTALFTQVVVSFIYSLSREKWLVYHARWQAAVQRYAAGRAGTSHC